MEREKRESVWYKNNGDQTYRLDYELNENSVVIDVGGYHGSWASDIYSMYGCSIHIFEPIADFADIIKRRFKNNSSIYLHNVAMGINESKATIYLDQGGTSLLKKTGHEDEACPL